MREIAVVVKQHRWQQLRCAEAITQLKSPTISTLCKVRFSPMGCNSSSSVKPHIAAVQHDAPAHDRKRHRHLRLHTHHDDIKREQMKQLPVAEAAAAAAGRIRTLNLALADTEHINQEELDKLWQQYDRDNNGVLNKQELHALAHDCIAHIVYNFELKFRQEHPTVHGKKLQRALEQKRPLLVPGHTAAESDAIVTNRLIHLLDSDGDRRVSKQELIVHWQTVSREFLRPQESSMCAVM